MYHYDHNYDHMSTLDPSGRGGSRPPSGRSARSGGHFGTRSSEVRYSAGRHGSGGGSQSAAGAAPRVNGWPSSELSPALSPSQHQQPERPSSRLVYDGRHRERPLSRGDVPSGGERDSSSRYSASWKTSASHGALRSTDCHEAPSSWTWPTDCRVSSTSPTVPGVEGVDLVLRLTPELTATWTPAGACRCSKRSSTCPSLTPATCALLSTSWLIRSWYKLDSHRSVRPAYRGLSRSAFNCRALPTTLVWWLA